MKMRNIYGVRLDQWFSTWGSRLPRGSFAIFLGPRNLLIKIFIIVFRFYISYMEPLFMVAKIVGSPGKNDNPQPTFPVKIVLSVIITITVQSTVTFGNARMTLLCCVCNLEESAVFAVAHLRVVQVCNELCYGVICIWHGSLTDAATCINLNNEYLFTIVISCVTFSSL